MNFVQCRTSEALIKADASHMRVTQEIFHVGDEGGGAGDDDDTHKYMQCMFNVHEDDCALKDKKTVMADDA